MFSRILILMLIAFTLPARAGILLEPIAGYSMGNYKITGTGSNPDTSLQNQSKSANIDGFAYGGRVGLNYSGFFLGGEYQATRSQLKFDGVNESTSWSNTTIFGVLGLDVGFGLRILAGMNVVPHVSEISTTPERTRYTGKAKKIGIGYRYSVPIAVNAEYIMYEFDKFQIGDLKGDAKDYFSKMSYSVIMLSLSFPFDFGGGGGSARGRAPGPG